MAEPNVATKSDIDFQESDLLHAQHLNVLREKYSSELSYRFIDQDSHPDSRYYEQIIFDDKQIPTRANSWHDYFNGLIWLSFPQTKAMLNHLHWQDIAKHGLKHRTPVRDRVTHFDECGIVLLTDIADVERKLKQHNWRGLFIDDNKHWFAEKNGIIPIHFGHANLEMLRKPFIGLTAKVLVIKSKEMLHHAHSSYALQSSAETRQRAQKGLDEGLLEYLTNEPVFTERGSLLPMPILGVPTWHNGVQDEDFYNNKDYFMPLSTKK